MKTAKGLINQAPIAPHVIDKGLPSTGLLAHFLAADRPAKPRAMGRRVRRVSGTEQSSGWRDKLVTDDLSGYKACFVLGVTEVGCMRGQEIPDGSASARAIDYSLKRWLALTRYLDDSDLLIDNQRGGEPHPADRAGRQNRLFAGGLLAGSGPQRDELDPVG